MRGAARPNGWPNVLRSILFPLCFPALWSAVWKRRSRFRAGIQTTDAINEVDFGTWSGLMFSQFASLPEWRAFNELRSLNPPPGGETFARLQARLLSLFCDLQRRFPGKCVALVSHADVIKAALSWLLGISADLFNRIEIDPGSLSVATLDDSSRPTRVLLMNETLGK